MKHNWSRRTLLSMTSLGAVTATNSSFSQIGSSSNTNLIPSAIQFQTVADLVQGISIDGIPVYPSDITDNGTKKPIVSTVWNNTESKSGGGSYVIWKLSDYCNELGDPNWLPSGTGAPKFLGKDHFIGEDQEYIAVLQQDFHVYPPQYGADPNGNAVDDTEAFNLCTQASKDYSEIQEVVIDLGGGDFNILGTVFVRKGQMLQGNGAHVFMAGTGGFKLGYKSDGITKDGGGHPIFIENLWIEGGLVPIDTRSVAGYTISNCFFSFSATGPIFAGTDGLIDLCVFDGGSTLVDFRATGSVMSNCNFFIGNTQLRIRDCDNSVISNCCFNYPEVSSIGWFDSGSVVGVQLTGCVFNASLQNSDKFQGFINSQATANGDLTFNHCQFRNCFEAAVKIASSSANHSLTFNDCLFDGNRTRATYQQSSTMYALKTTSLSDGQWSFQGCRFNNLLDVPFQINSEGDYIGRVFDCSFNNNAGTTSILANKGSSDSKLKLGNIEGDGKNLLSFTSAGNLIVLGWLKNWLSIHKDGDYCYVEVPFSGAALLEVTLIANANSGGSTQYRQITSKLASITYDYSNGLVTQGTLTDVFDSTSPVGLSLDIDMHIDLLGSGPIKSGISDPGVAIFGWSESYTSSRIDIQYKHMQAP